MTNPQKPTKKVGTRDVASSTAIGAAMGAGAKLTGKRKARVEGGGLATFVLVAAVLVGMLALMLWLNSR
jgi:hypothetical protein